VYDVKSDMVQDYEYIIENEGNVGLDEFLDYLTRY